MRQLLLNSAYFLSRLPYFKGRDRLQHILFSQVAKSGHCRVEVENLLFDLNLADALSRSVFLTGHLPASTWRLLRHVLGPGMRFVDVGANIGYTTLVAARAVGETGQVYAFEPSPRAFQSLARNVRLNDLGWVQLEQAACGEQAAEQVLHVSSWSDEYCSLGEDDVLFDQTVPCKVVRLDEYLNERGGRVDAVKIDVEGAEWQVLRGLTEMLTPPLPLLVVESCTTNTKRFDYKPSEMFAWLRGFGYEFMILTGARGVVPYSAETADAALCDVICLNEQWRPRVTEAQRRLAANGG
ncbi:MAG TPA: FkbM family methyltransferase [Pyrinomonadaceae bacterium]|jgi:FkbM family methyltransferase